MNAVEDCHLILGIRQQAHRRRFVHNSQLDPALMAGQEFKRGQTTRTTSEHPHRLIRPGDMFEQPTGVVGVLLGPLCRRRSVERAA
ncbi:MULTISPECIES: hypothetical protein [unclassified Streptomyces]|uniref:hypothetical protein n=1 Tax=unclassified Streptomyces TaxID=2593676 RepID=UPI00038060A4|nr:MULTISPECIES: hypothetical protein [unclassified Streptomyces]MYT32300.1 hypothetical protein [Streptomyces sp. SID8354]